ncbi:MAG: protocatechuate 3,4-dioxygenase subunit alpha [Micrococcales bacterium]|nr:protocatechuate 3,4-dioxygenase subunit alpha [Micrococcales bacterium]
MSEQTAQADSQQLAPTPGQTIGPFFGYALPFERGHELVPPATPGAVRFHGTVRDGHGEAVPDALIEIAQADASGQIAQAEGSFARDGMTFTGWGRCPVDASGRFSFTTLEPGSLDGAAPFIAVTVFARGLLNRVFTRAYLPGDDSALAADALLGSLPQDRRATLVAVREADGSLRFDINLQGESETVFLTYPRHDA